MKSKMGVIYFIQQGEDDCFKIGKTKVSTKRRLVENQVGNSKKLRIYGKVKCDNVNEDELKLHNKYFAKKETGEWYNLTPYEVEEEIDSWGDKGKVLIRTPKPNSVIRRSFNFIVNNKVASFMYVYLQILSFNLTYSAMDKYFSYMSNGDHIHAAITLVVCSQPFYWFFFDALSKAAKKRF